MKKVLILEDNRSTLCLLEKLVKETDNNLVVYAFTNAKDACECMLDHKIDLFLVDIILDTGVPGDTSGLYFAQKVRRIERYSFTPLVFITSLMDSKFILYEEFHCYSFIEKPFDPQRVKTIVKDCLQFPGSDPEWKTLWFRKEGIVQVVALEEVVYVESIDHILYIHTNKAGVVKIPYIKLKDFLQKADSKYIQQCRRNTIINLRYMDNIDVSNGIIQFKDGRRVDMGVTYKKKIKEAIRILSNDMFL